MPSARPITLWGLGSNSDTGWRELLRFHKRTLFLLSPVARRLPSCEKASAETGIDSASRISVGREDAFRLSHTITVSSPPNASREPSSENATTETDPV